MGAPPAGGGIQIPCRAEADGLDTLVDILVCNRDRFLRLRLSSSTEWCVQLHKRDGLPQCELFRKPQRFHRCVRSPRRLLTCPSLCNDRLGSASR